MRWRKKNKTIGGWFQRCFVLLTPYMGKFTAHIGEMLQFDKYLSRCSETNNYSQLNRIADIQKGQRLGQPRFNWQLCWASWGKRWDSWRGAYPVVCALPWWTFASHLPLERAQWLHLWLVQPEDSGYHGTRFANALSVGKAMNTKGRLSRTLSLSIIQDFKVQVILLFSIIEYRGCHLPSKRKAPRKIEKDASDLGDRPGFQMDWWCELPSSS